MEAYSVDLRERVMVAVEERVDIRKEIAESFGVTASWAIRVKKDASCQRTR